MTMEQAFTVMQENGCLPEDFTVPDLGDCDDQSSESLKLQCIANR